MKKEVKSQIKKNNRNENKTSAHLEVRLTRFLRKLPYTMRQFFKRGIRRADNQSANMQMTGCGQ